MRGRTPSDSPNASYQLVNQRRSWNGVASVVAKPEDTAASQRSRNSTRYTATPDEAPASRHPPLATDAVIQAVPRSDGYTGHVPIWDDGCSYPCFLGKTGAGGAYAKLMSRG